MDAKAKENEAVYVMSVAAKLAGVHPQTLRIYERKGLLTPARVHNRRRYSDEDIRRCRLITQLTQVEGINLAGVKMILDLRDHVETMRREMSTLEQEMEHARASMESEMERLRNGLRNEIVLMPRSDLVRLRETDLFPFRPKRS